MRKLIYSALLLATHIFAVAQVTKPQPDSKPKSICGATCTPPYCPPTDPNGCGILD